MGQSLSRPLSVVTPNPLLVTRHSVLKKQVVSVAQKVWSELRNSYFLGLIQFVWDPITKLFHVSNQLQVENSCKIVNVELSVTYCVVSSGLVSTIVFNLLSLTFGELS